MVLKKAKKSKNPHTFAQTLNQDLGFFWIFVVCGVWACFGFFCKFLKLLSVHKFKVISRSSFQLPKISFLQNTASSEVSLSEITESRLNQKISSFNIMNILDFCQI